jgi:hypothetical protein
LPSTPDTLHGCGCQRNIANKIISRKADDILALKANRGTPSLDKALSPSPDSLEGWQLELARMMR